MAKQLFMEITKKCNQNCIFCIHPYNRKDATDVDFEFIKKRIREAIKEKVDYFLISGGEPTMHKNILEIVSYAKKLKIKNIELQSNGQNLSNMSFVKKLKKNGITKINVSFHAHTEKLLNSIRGVNKGYHKTIRGMKNCLKAGIKLGIIIVNCSENYKKLPGLIKFIDKNFAEADNINISLVAPEGRVLNNTKLVMKYSDFKPYLIKALEICKKSKIKNFDVSSTVPLCLVDGYENHVISTIFLLTKHVIIDDHCNVLKIKDIKSKEFNNLDDNLAGKAPQCSKCTLNSICVGFFPKYGEINGYDDFIPSKKSLKDIVKQIKKYNQI